MAESGNQVVVLLVLLFVSYSAFSAHHVLIPWNRKAPYPAWAGSHHQNGLASSPAGSDPLSRATLIEAELLSWVMNKTIMVTTRICLKDIILKDPPQVVAILQLPM